MAVLFDSFSYRIKEVESGICYDRWHFGKYPELTMPEHLYYLNRVINCLLTHDKIIIRTDSLEEIIDVLGFEAFRLLYERQELVIIDNWWFPAFMIGNENLLFMNMHKSNYYDKVIERINNKYGFQASLFIKQVFEKVTSDSESEEYVYWDHIAQENMYEDFTINNQIRTYLNIESENILDINEKDTWSAVRLCLFERSIVWGSYLQTDEIILEDEAKYYFMQKNNLIPEQTLNDRMNKYLFARNIPNLSLLYYNKIIDIKKIIQVRDHAFGGFYRDWLQSNNYNINELERILLGGNSSSQAEKWFRWGLVSVTGLILPAVGGLAASLLNEKIPSFSQKIPNIFFDHVLSQVFNTRKNRNALLALK